MIAWIVPFFAEKRQGRGCFSSAPLALFQRICHPVQGGGVVLIQQVGVDLARGGGGGVAQGLADVEQGRALGGGHGGEGVPLRYNYDKPEKPRISRVFGYLARFFILFQTEKSSREVVIS